MNVVWDNANGVNILNHLKLVFGKIWTGNPAQKWAEAFCIEGDRICKTGDKDEVLRFAEGQDYEVLDYGENVILPGISDSHIHLTAYAKQELYLDLSSAVSLDDAGEKLRGYAEGLPKGAWIRALNYNEKTWESQVKPDIAFLDDLALDHPILLSRYCGHFHVANAKALRSADMWDTKDPYVIRNKDGSHTGHLTEGAAGPILEMIASIYETDEKTVEMLHRACLKLASMGITAVHACDAPSYALEENIAACQELQEEGRLPLRIACYFDKLPNYSIKSGFGNEMLSFAGFKIFADGNLGAHTCAVREPFHDEPENAGVLNHTDEELYALIREAQERKIQLEIHIIGDRALEQVIRTIERITEEIGHPALPHRIVHAIICPSDLLERLKKLHVVVDVQMIQIYIDRDMAPAHIGDRISHCYAYRSICDAGVIMAGGSDAPVENPNPWHGIWAAVNISDLEGKTLKGHSERDRLTLDEALTIYTSHPWKALGKGGVWGKIETGYRADFTVVFGDPFHVDPMELREVTHLATFVGGECLWQKNR